MQERAANTTGGVQNLSGQGRATCLGRDEGGFGVVYLCALRMV